MAIEKNLRQLRLSSGMTQEQVAERVGVTRQAMSSYESGRTRPDINMLMCLAEVYGTDLNSILYGRERERKVLRRLKVIAAAVLGLLLLLTLACSALRWSGNLFLPISEGILKEGVRATWERRQSLNNLLTAAETCNLILSRVGPVLLLILMLVWKCSVPLKEKLALMGVWLGGMGLVTLPFAWTDPVMGLWDYLAVPVNIAVRVLFFWLLALAIDEIRSRRRKRHPPAPHAER